MRILLIGGTGFIGSFLVPALEQAGAELAVLTRGKSKTSNARGLTRITGDRNRLEDSASAIRKFAPDVVVDLVLAPALRPSDSWPTRPSRLRSCNSR